MIRRSGQVGKPAIVSLFALVVGVTGALAQSPSPSPSPDTATPAAKTSSFDAAQTTDIQTIVRAYLVKHPEVLVEAMQALQEKQDAEQRTAQAKTIETLRPQLTASPKGTVLGDPNGDVTITEFFDYNCPYCKKAATDMDAVLADDPKLRVVLKEVAVLGPASVSASQAALAFRQLKPEEYPQFQRKLLKTPGRVDAGTAKALAEKMGVPRKELEAAMDSKAVKQAFDDSNTLAGTLSISGTPSYVIGNEVLAGAVGADNLEKAVANMRSCGSATC